MASVFNVRDFGAVGDGVHDDRAAIQAATDAAATEGGGVVYFPDGVFLIKGRQPTLRNQSRRTDGVVLRSHVHYLGVGSRSEIRQDRDCCFSFAGHLYAPFTDPTKNALHNLRFERLRFTKPDATWFAEAHHLNLDSVTGLVIDQCEFIGWSGDAMSIGFNINDDLSAWLPSRVENVTIQRCLFDGVTKNTRNAISMDSGVNVWIMDNVFRRMTRPDMPGAFDLEPEGPWAVIDGFHIKDNVFEDVGGLGVVCFSLVKPTRTTPRHFAVEGNVMRECTADCSVLVHGLRSTTHTELAPSSPENFRLAGNTHVGMAATSRIWIAGGISDLVIESELVKRERTAHLTAMFGGGPGVSTLNGPHPIRGLWFRNNVVSGWRVARSSGFSPIMIEGAVLGGLISGNAFRDCGHEDGSFRTIGFYGAGAESRDLAIVDNSFINTQYAPRSVPVEAVGATTLRHPATIRVENNRVHGLDAAAAAAGQLQRQLRTDPE